MRRWVAGFIALAATQATPAFAADEDEGDAASDGLNRAVYGAKGPELGDIVLRGSVGMALILPHFVLAGRLGVSGGAFIEGGYGNLAGFGQEIRGKLGWGIAIADDVDVGLAARTSYATLALADGALVGIQFTSLPIGNDWEVGNDIVLSWHRPGNAHITLSAGPTFTLGGERFTAFEESEFQFDPSARSIDAGIQAEWSIWTTANVFVRLDAQFLLGVEEDEACAQAGQENCSQLVPFGFIPTGAVGVAWAI